MSFRNVCSCRLAGVVVLSLLSCGRAWAYLDDQRPFVVEVTAQADTSTPAVVLSWPANTNNIWPYTLFRRTPGETNWDTGVDIGVAGGSYTDTTVTAGSAREYRIRFPMGEDGYIFAGLDVPMTETRGKVILLVDSTMAGPLSNELARLKLDLAGDGWTVLRHDVSRTMTVPGVKAIVKAYYDADPANVKSLFIFGHVPVPYSGELVPDGHGFRALPTDLYYAELYGTTWTDSSVSNNSWQIDWPYMENWNIPGDGKFDQNSIASPPELEVGRVDLYNMPVFNPLTETDLLRRYLDKNHAFRQAQMNIPRRGLVDAPQSGFPFTERDGWRNFAPCVGPSNAVSAAWWTMATNSYLWAYSCGFGDWQSDPRANFATQQLNTVFTMRFGSYSVDWNDPDNVLRCILASAPSGLTCSWSGGPFNRSGWFYHPMALGYTAGYSARYTQQTFPEVRGQDCFVYMCLMGDPTLRLHPVAPASNLVAATYADGVALNWGAAQGPVRGYAVYRAPTMDAPFVRLTEPVTGRAFFDSDPSAGPCVYMVRAVVREQSPSGTYFNQSQGIFVSATGNGTAPPAPTGLSASDGAYSDRVRLSWNVSPPATLGYEVWRSTTNNPVTAARIATPLDASYDDPATWETVTNYYWVAARNGAGTGALSVVDSGCKAAAAPLPPMGVTASDSTFTNRIRVLWNALAYQAATYEVWRGTAPDSASASLVTNSISGTNYDDWSATSCTNTCYYWVKSVKLAVASPFGAPDRGSLRLLPPTVIQASDGLFTGRVAVAWSPVAGASGYQLWVGWDTNRSSASMYAAGTGTNCDYVGGTPGQFSWFYVRATNAWGGSDLSAGDTGYSFLLSADPVYASDGAFTNAVFLSWQYVPGAYGYGVWRSTINTLGTATMVGAAPTYTGFFDSNNVTADTMYYYWICATNNTGAFSPFSAAESGYRTSAVPPSVPLPPTGVTASDGLYTNHIAIAWNASEGAVGYTVLQAWRLNTGWAYRLVDVSGTTFDYLSTQTGIRFFWVKARNAAGLSDFSASDSGFVANLPPGPVEASDGSYTDRVQLVWPDTGNFDDFEIWRSATNDPGTAALIGTMPWVGETCYADSNTAPGAVCYYWVKGSNTWHTTLFSQGDSGYRAVAAPPAMIAASDGAFTDRVCVVWSPSAAATSYAVWRSATANPEEATGIGGTATTNFDDLSVTPLTVYTYWVKAIGGGVTSGVSAADSGYAWTAGSPPPPGTVSASDGTFTDRIRVTWSPAPPPVGLYQIWRSTINDRNTATHIVDTGSLSTNSDDSTTTSSALYYYWIRSVNAAVTSDWSTADSGWRTLPPPATVQASDGAFTNRIEVAWSAVGEATTYEVWRGAVDNGGSATKIAETAATNFADTAAAEWTAWYYRIKAKNAVALSSFSRSDSGWRGLSGPPPPPPSVLASDGTYTNLVRIVWTSLIKASGYQVWVGPANDIGTAALAGLISDGAYDYAAATESPYYFWVRATNALGDGGFSSGDIGFRALSGPDGIEAAPRSGVAISLRWSDRSAVETGFELQCKIGAVGDYTTIAMVDSNVTSYVNTGLLPGIQYVYRVRAYNAYGSSAWTAEAAAVPVWNEGSNSVPYTESFEDYSTNFMLIGTNGWRADRSDAAQITGDAAVLAGLTESYHGHYAIATNHTQVLEVRSAISSAIAGPTGTNIWTDMLVDARRSERAPVAPEEAQVGFYVNTNGHFVLWHQDWATGSNRWTVLAHLPFATDAWVRVSVRIDYSVAPPARPDQHFYRFYLNGAMQTNAAGYTAHDGTGLPGGSWYALASTNAASVTGVIFPGTGYLDDLVVSTEAPYGLYWMIVATAGDHGAIVPSGTLTVENGGGTNFTITPDGYYHVRDVQVDATPVGVTNGYAFAAVTNDRAIAAAFADNLAANDVPEWWLASYGWTNDFDAASTNDADCDGMAAWQEYLAGTDPSDKLSVFMIRELMCLAGSNRLVWWTYTNWVNTPFTVERSTNLMGGGWQKVDSNVGRTPPTNIWWDTAPVPAGPSFYRLIVTNAPQEAL
jgi:fibronectin type 3 domain-containing protein